VTVERCGLETSLPGVRADRGEAGDQPDVRRRAALRFCVVTRTVVMIGGMRDVENRRNRDSRQALTGSLGLQHAAHGRRSLGRHHAAWWTMGVEPFLVASAGARILRPSDWSARSCQICRREETNPAEKLRRAGAARARRLRRNDLPCPLKARRTASRCRHTGYRGRMSISASFALLAGRWAKLRCRSARGSG